DAGAVGDAGDLKVDVAAQVRLLRDDLPRQLAPDLPETEKRGPRAAPAALRERPHFVELILVVQRAQRRGGVLLADGDGDVELRGALGDGDDVHARGADRGERPRGDAGVAAHAEADDRDEGDAALRGG